jgi:SAM-dependent methyltransferase
MSHSDFDATADEFDRFRAFPAEVSTAIRNALRAAVGDSPGALFLDLGAGTGRIGEAFVAAGDAYIAIDPSAAMLARFAAKSRRRAGLGPLLVQADGQSLPFLAGTFDAVLIAHVLGGARAWQKLLCEARRVLRPGGRLAVGQRIGPQDGVDAQMRQQLSMILTDLGVDATRPGARRDDVRGWMQSNGGRIEEIVAARWAAMPSPRAFLARHATGARFAALMRSTREEALRRLEEWALTAFGSLNTPRVEPHAFVLDIGLW